MEVNFKADFERTMEFRSLSKAVEREARELQVLRQVKNYGVGLFGCCWLKGVTYL